jgi:glyoxylase-like metal-dependent hydrolase (beta-lactamase superfamily II)
MNRLNPYELFALRYATRPARAEDLFLAADPHEGARAVDYFVWLARRSGHVCLIDTGFGAAAGERRRRELLRDPIDSLELLGTDRTRVQDVVLTHFHYDHAGNFDRLPNAIFHVQESEMRYATGPHMARKPLNAAYEPDEVASLVRHVFQDRVKFHDGESAVSDGITLHHVGGHTAGQQFVRVFTRRGWVIVASDASHFYDGYLSCRPLRLAFDVGDMVRGFERIRAFAESDAHVVPGHDPAVMNQYPAVSPALEGVAVRLDVNPCATAPA